MHLELLAAVVVGEGASAAAARLGEFVARNATSVQFGRRVDFVDGSSLIRDVAGAEWRIQTGVQR
jgi:hypothetical protein